MRFLRKFGIVAVGVALLFSGIGCDTGTLIEIPETSEPTENALAITSNIVSTYDILEDFASSNKILGKDDEVLLPASASIVFIDQEFTDGDGIEFEINFGEMGATEPFGSLCLDGVYRAGKLNVKLDKPYTETNGTLIASASSDYPFYSGDGTDLMSFIGTLAITRKSESLVNVETDDLSGNLRNSNYAFTCDLDAEKIVDGGTGIKGDEIEFDGDATVSIDEEKLTLVVDKPLKKSYKDDCLNNIVEGVVALASSTSLSEIEVDFDPLQNAECDRLVSITINGKSINYHY